MAAGYDGSIRIDTRIDSRGFNTGIKSMIGTLGKFASAVGVAFGIGAIVRFGATAVKEASSLASAMIGLQSVVDGQGKSFAGAKKFINDYIADGLIPATNAITAYKNLSLRGYDTSQIKEALTILKDTAAFGRQASLSMGTAVQTATEGLKNENSILVDNAGVTKNVAKMWKDYAASIGTTVGALTKQQKIEAEVAGLRQESIYQTGDAAKMTGTYAGQVASLGAAFTSLKVAVGNVFMPILQKIIPVIIQVVNWLTALATRAAQVIQMLLGIKVSASGYEQMAAGANAAADAQENLAGSTQDAGKAAKGALAPFDELNVLAQSDGDSGAGGGVDAGAIGGLDMEEGTSPLDALSDTMDGLKAKLITLFEPAQEPFQRFKDQVIELGGKIWDGLKWVWNNILVPIGEWAITKALPVFLDLLAASLDVINTTIDTLKPLGTWLWEEFLKPAGEWVGQAIIDSLTWMVEKLGELSDWIADNQATVETIAIVIGSFAAAWGLASAALAIYNVVAGIAAGITAFLASPIFLVALAIGAVIAIIVLLIRHWDKVKEVGVKVWEWMRGAWEDVSTWVGQAISDIGQFFVNIWEWIKTAVSDAWNWIVGIWEGAATWFMETVINPLIEFFTPLFELIGILANNAWVVIKFIWEKVKVWFDEHVITPVREAFSTFWEAIRNLATTAWEKIVEIWTVVSEWFNEHVITPVTKFFTTLWDGISLAASTTWDTIKGVWAAVATWWKEHVTQPLTDAWTNFTDWLGEKWNSVWDAVGNYLKGVLNGVINILNSVLSSVFGGINTLIGKINDVGGIVPGWKTIPTFVVPQIPKLATGAVIPANAPFAAILGDQRSGRNIEAPESLIRQIFQEEMTGMGGSQEVTIKFGGTMGALVRAMKPYVDSENRRIGASMITGGVS